MSFKNRSAASIKSQSKESKKCGSHVFTDQELDLLIDVNDEEVPDLSFLGDYRKHNSK